LAGRCSTVFANDRSDLNQVFAVTKERGVHPMERDDIASWVVGMLQDKYYRTEFGPPIPVHSGDEERPFRLAQQKFSRLLSRFASSFLPSKEGLVFGCVATRMAKGFITTARGKKDLLSTVLVNHVDHNQRVVNVSGNVKATLNAPLLDWIFLQHPRVYAIVHYHEVMDRFPIHEYAPPGTAGDSMRDIRGSFNIEHHGCYLLLDQDGVII
jgi:hypothetical protein